MPEPIQTLDLGFVNAYLVSTAQGFVLIDTGLSGQWEKLEAQLSQAGCLPDRLKLILITHGDGDHTGNCARLRQQTGARIAMHPADVPLVAEGPKATPPRHGRSFLSKLMLAIGGMVAQGSNFVTFQPDLLLADGQDLSEFGLPARVLHVPGHTAGSVAFLFSTGELVTGDTISHQGRVGVAPFIENDDQLRASLATLKGLTATTIYPGHGKPFPYEQIKAIEF